MTNSRGNRRDPATPLVAFAVDLDRTLRAPGSSAVGPPTKVLDRVRRLGLKVVLVSGREHAMLAAFAQKIRSIDAIVAENGAVIEAPVGGDVRVIGRATAARVRRRLAQAPWAMAEYGTVVTSFPRASEPRVRNLMRGLEVEFVPNVDRTMILPRGVTKATGTRLALRALHLGSSAFAAIGDGENDLPLLDAAELSGAVRNARPQVRASVDYVCRAPYLAGVAEFVRGPLVRRLGA